jgi:hypothetical protein
VQNALNIVQLAKQARADLSVANIYLPPLKTIDIYFLRQIMTGEKKVSGARLSMDLTSKKI